MKLTLISKPECPFCWKVKLALGYFRVNYQLRESKQHEAAELSTHSPQMSVPILVDNWHSWWDSAAIIYYLEDRFAKEKTLFPGSLIQRSLARHVDIYSNSIIGPRLREVVFAKRNKPCEDWDWSLINRATKEWRETWPWLESQHNGGEHFMADGFSIVECALLPRFALADHYGVPIQQDFPKIYHWYQSWQEKDLLKNSLPWK